MVFQSEIRLFFLEYLSEYSKKAGHSLEMARFAVTKIVNFTRRSKKC